MRIISSWTDGAWRNGIISVVFISVIGRGRGLEAHGEVGVFIIILGIQVESECLSVCSLLNKDVTDYFMVEHVVSPTFLNFNWLFLTALEGECLQAIIHEKSLIHPLYLWY